MKRTLALLLVVALALVSTGCLTNHHTVGDGPRGIEVRKDSNWYVLWGLVCISNNETRNMVGNASDYEITTGMSWLDVFINFFTFPFSLLRQTTSLEK